MSSVKQNSSSSIAGLPPTDCQNLADEKFSDPLQQDCKIIRLAQSNLKEQSVEYKPLDLSHFKTAISNLKNMAPQNFQSYFGISNEAPSEKASDTTIFSLPQQIAQKISNEQLVTPSIKDFDIQFAAQSRFKFMNDNQLKIAQNVLSNITPLTIGIVFGTALSVAAIVCTAAAVWYVAIPILIVGAAFFIANFFVLDLVEKEISLRLQKSCFAFEEEVANEINRVNRFNEAYKNFIDLFNTKKNEVCLKGLDSDLDESFLNLAAAAEKLIPGKLLSFSSEMESELNLCHPILFDKVRKFKGGSSLSYKWIDNITTLNSHLSSVKYPAILIKEFGKNKVVYMNIDPSKIIKKEANYNTIADLNLSIEKALPLELERAKKSIAAFRLSLDKNFYKMVENKNI